MQALLEPAVLAPVPLGLVDLTVPLRHAVVDALVLDRALEETLASEGRDGWNGWNGKR